MYFGCDGSSSSKKKNTKEQTQEKEHSHDGNEHAHEGHNHESNEHSHEGHAHEGETNVEHENGFISETKFKVSGNCSMCKTRIEEAAKKVEGVQGAQWDKEKQLLYIKLNKEIEINKVHTAIALVGHDTENITADDRTYKSLPECCHYRK